MGLFSKKKPSAKEKEQKELEQLIPTGEGMVTEQSAQEKEVAEQGTDGFAGEKPTVTDPILAYREGKMDVSNIIAPNRIDIDFDYIKINDVYLRTLFISGYPRFVAPGWLEQVINFNSSLDISFFIYPVKGKDVLDDLMRKIAEM